MNKQTLTEKEKLELLKSDCWQIVGESADGIVRWNNATGQLLSETNDGYELETPQSNTITTILIEVIACLMLLSWCFAMFMSPFIFFK